MMAIDLEHALTELAHTPPVGDDSFPAGSMTATVRRMATHVRRRRAARYAGTSMVGAAAVAAIAVGGNMAKSHYAAAAGPSTALSKRAGVECGKPFDPAGKSDPRFEADLFAVIEDDTLPPGKYMQFGGDLRGVATGHVARPSTSPATAIVIKAGVVVGITEALTDVQVFDRQTPDPDAEPGPFVFVSAAEATNCSGTVPAPVTENMFDVVVLRDYAVAGEPETALVITPPAPGPLLTVPGADTTSPAIPPNWISFGFSRTGDEVTLAFKGDDYHAVEKTADAPVPLFVVDKDGYAPYLGKAEAHATGDGRIVVTADGVTLFELSGDRI